MLHEVNFLSYNERDTVFGWIYVPAAEPKGIVQIIHGYGEHSRRYLHMISALLCPLASNKMLRARMMTSMPIV